MKRAAEVKPSVRRCSEEPVAGDGSICAVSITKRAKLEEPEAADGTTRRSPKLVAAGIAMKRARKPDKPSKKEKRAEEKGKRSSKKKRTGAEEKPNKVEVVHDLSMEEKIMAKLAELDKERAEEKSKRSNQDKRIEEILMRIEKIEEQVAGDGMKKEKIRTKKPEGIEVADNKVMREMADNEVVAWRLSQELLEYLRTKEVVGLLAAEAPLPLWTNKTTRALFPEDNLDLKEEIAAEFQENREFDAHVLYQYRTKGYVEIEEEVSDEEVDDKVSDKEDDVEADGILGNKPSKKASKKEKVAEEKSRRSNQEKRTEEKIKQPNKVEGVSYLTMGDFVTKNSTMEGKINAELAEIEKNKKKRLLTVELSQAHMKDYLSYEVLDYMVANPMVTFRECNLWQIDVICDPYSEARYLASHRRSIETQANVLQQYRTNGSAVIQFEATDDEAE